MTEEEKKRGPEGDQQYGLPHWSEPATGQFPKVEVSQATNLTKIEALSPEWGQDTDLESSVNKTQRIDVTIGEDPKQMTSSPTKSHLT